MYFSVFWCPLSYYCFFCLFWFLLHNHHQYPRRPRGSQEKRRSESFLADWLPLGLQGSITTVPPLKGQSQHCSFWYGRVLDQSQQKRHFFACVQTSPISFVARGKGPFSACNKGNRRRLHAGNIFSAKIQSTAKFFSSSSQEENLSFLSGKSTQKCLIISPSNQVICTWLRGTSGFLPVPVDIVVPTISFAFEIGNHTRLDYE